MSRSARAVTGLAAAGLLTAVAGCAGATTVAGTSGTTPAALTNTPATSAAASPSRKTVTFSAPPAPETTSRPSPTAPVATRACLARVSVLYPDSDTPLRAVCVRVGGTVAITLTVARHYRWTTPTSSSPAVATIGDVHTGPDGALYTIATAHAPGTATFNATDSFTPDPYGHREGERPGQSWCAVRDLNPESADQ